MGFFDLFKTLNINDGVDEFRNTEGAVLIDVRTEDEYRQGHIEGSVNIPLDKISSVGDTVKDMNTPLFVHCYSGSRSGQAVAVLKKIGYNNVKNIGGIVDYIGKVVR